MKKKHYTYNFKNYLTPLQEIELKRLSHVVAFIECINKKLVAIENN